MKGIIILNCMHCFYIEDKWGEHPYCRISTRDDRSIPEDYQIPDWCSLANVKYEAKRGGD